MAKKNSTRITEESESEESALYCSKKSETTNAMAENPKESQKESQKESMKNPTKNQKEKESLKESYKKNP